MKKNIVIVVLLCLVFALGGYIVGTSINNTSKDSTNEKNKKKEIDPNTLLDKMVGDWGRCDAEYECYGILVQKNSDTYTYLSYVMWSEAGGNAPIKVTKITDENNFEIKMHFDAYEDATIQYDAHDVELKISTSKIDENILIVDGKEYKKVVGDSEQFYLNLF